MARTKLNLLLKEVDKYLGLPYARNIWKNNVLTKEAIFGGKANWLDIAYATKCAADFEKINLTELSQAQVYNLQKRHGIGIDCSGLVYHLADYWDKIHGNTGILFKVISNNPKLGKFGPRSLSADQLTSPHNATPITGFSHIKTADFIRVDRGRHILFIVQNLGNQIIYVHSSERTQTRGTHLGQIHLTQPLGSLKDQLWSDITLDSQPYTTLVSPENGDGVYRLNIFTDPIFLL